MKRTVCKGSSQELEEKLERLENSFDPESGNLDALGKTER